jgi:hypothetical protein
MAKVDNAAYLFENIINFGKHDMDEHSRQFCEFGHPISGKGKQVFDSA